MKIGSKRIVIGNSNDHQFELGTIVEIFSEITDEKEYQAKISTSFDPKFEEWWYVKKKDLRKIQPGDKIRL